MRRLVLLALSAMVVLAAPAAAHDKHGGGLKKIDHFVVIYQENHSFDNLYGKWEKVDGLRDADVAHTRQIDQAGAPSQCLMQNDVNLTSPPLSPVCTGTDANGNTFTSHFLNAPPFASVPVHLAGSGGEVRLTSFCMRQPNGALGEMQDGRFTSFWRRQP